MKPFASDRRRIRPPDPSRCEDGFTLMELMVVVLIIAVLLATAMAAFVGSRQRAEDRAAQATARQALGTFKSIVQQLEDYNAVDVTLLQSAEPALAFLDHNQPSDSRNEVSVDLRNVNDFIVAAFSKTGTCWYIRDEAVPSSGGTSYARKSSNGSDCTAGSPPGAFTARW